MRTLLVTAIVAALVSTPVRSAGARVRVERRYPNGALMSLEWYQDGRKVGHHDTWWPNGQRRSSANFHADAFDGEYRTWRADGSPYELRHYADGRETGLQQSWDESGRLYLNYEVRNGRRYGFINATPCLPADLIDGTSTYPRESSAGR